MTAPSRRRSPVPVLMYHDIVETSGAAPEAYRRYMVTVTRFEEQLRTLADLGIPGTRLDDHLGGQDAAHGAARTCVITFDDGHESNYTRALPLLRQYGFKATFFLTVGWVGTASYLTWGQVKELAAAGMEIGSHSMTHRAPAKLSLTELRSEMQDSKKILEDRLGLPVVTASSPTGFYNPAMIPVAREAGYRALCFGRIGLWKDPSLFFAVPRVPIKFGMSAARLRRIALGDPLTIALLRGQQIVRDGLKTTLGINRYLRFRRTMLRLLTPRS
jgi:peptidoglycan/xylan/chitin deacetylase (PgdA/CDA1 family)